MENSKNLIANSYKLKELKANSYSKNITVEEKAEMLIETLKADINFKRWYCQVINTLPENIIQNILEGAKRASKPAFYFAKAAKVEMMKQPNE